MKSNKEDETSKTQADKFRDLARQLECDADEEAFDEALRKIAKAPRAPSRDDKKP